MTGALLNPFTTGNPFLGTKLLGISIGRGLGALKELIIVRIMPFLFFFALNNVYTWAIGFVIRLCTCGLRKKKSTR